ASITQLSPLGCKMYFKQLIGVSISGASSLKLVCVTTSTRLSNAVTLTIISDSLSWVTPDLLSHRQSSAKYFSRNGKRASSCLRISAVRALKYSAMNCSGVCINYCKVKELVLLFDTFW